jgi:hypothetical protein
MVLWWHIGCSSSLSENNGHNRQWESPDERRNIEAGMVVVVYYGSVAAWTQSWVCCMYSERWIWKWERRAGLCSFAVVYIGIRWTSRFSLRCNESRTHCRCMVPYTGIRFGTISSRNSTPKNQHLLAILAGIRNKSTPWNFPVLMTGGNSWHHNC